MSPFLSFFLCGGGTPVGFKRKPKRKLACLEANQPFTVHPYLLSMMSMLVNWGLFENEEL